MIEPIVLIVLFVFALIALHLIAITVEERRWG
jgi:hypothetical protein